MDPPFVSPFAPFPAFEQPELTRKPTALGHSYCVTEEIWDQMRQMWAPFVGKPLQDVGDALFVVRHRRYTRDPSEEIFSVVEIKSQHIIDILRLVCKTVDSVFSMKPSVDSHELYPYIDSLHGFYLDHANDAENAPALEHLKSFMEYLEEEYEPIRHKLENLLRERKITFNLLWAVFKAPLKLRATHGTSKEMMGVILDSLTYASDPNGKKLAQLNGRSIKWDGQAYDFVAWNTAIQPFKGAKLLAELPVSVLTKEDEAILTAGGRLYTQYSGVHHVHNKGNIIPAKQRNPTDATEILAEGRAMIDTVQYNKEKANPTVQQFDGYDPYPPRPPSPQMFGTPFGGPGGAMKAVMQKEPPRSHVPDNELYLLPPTVFGFSLVRKVWGEIRVKDLAPVVYDEQAWDRLVLDDDTKILIRSLVEVHANANNVKTSGSGVSNADNTSIADDPSGLETVMLTDWIKGKGGGLIVLLHGIAGVGKTLTAEAVAEQLHRPLYVIGCGELGFYPNVVEQKLRNALDLAAAWNAVVLIDEADVFLERRQTSDMQRNALVGSFLRLLEYHTGVLFLTTNRVKSFDKAFLSRISVAIKYPDLGVEQRAQIWKQFLQWVVDHSTKYEMEILSEECIKELAAKPFNGRIIKNVVRTAQALSISSKQPLSMKHIRSVIAVTEKFLRDTDTNVVQEEESDDEQVKPVAPWQYLGGDL